MIKQSHQCTGCGACLNICPFHAISMVKKNGYEYPIIDHSACIQCNKCSKVCMLETKIETFKSREKYEFRMVSDDILNSSSGGFCYILSKSIIEKEGGIVYSAIFNKEKRAVEHVRIDSSDDIKKTRGSKYVKSNHYQVFSSIKSDLELGRTVLFIGLPCENYGLISYLGKKYDNLYTVSLLCGGAVSNVYFAKYINELELRLKNQISAINFRNKKYGSSILCTSVTFEDKKEKILSNSLDYFIPLEGSRFVRPSCHQCNFALDNILGDFVVGDCFGGAERKKGVSVVATDLEQRVVTLLEKLNIVLVKNNNLIVSSRAINNRKTRSIIPSEDEYKLFMDDCLIDLKKSVKKHIYKKYTPKQKIYRILPYSIKSIIVK